MSGEAYELWKWLHILLLVFWLGADVGVFICGSWIRRTDLTAAERIILLRVSAVIDLWPRVSAALMLPVGATLAQTWLPGMPVGWVLAAWGVAAVWLGLTFAGIRLFGTAAGERIQTITNVFLVALAAVCLVGGFWWLRVGEAAASPWVGWKLVLYGLVCVIAIGIDKAFKPVISGFGLLGEAGRLGEANGLITRGMNRTLLVVATLYGVLLVASLIGVTKPV